MKYYTFHRSDNNFDDILKDPSLSKLIDEKISWRNYLMIGISDDAKNNQAFSYITIKYGDDMVTSLVRDFRPLPGIDYVPKRDASKYKKSIE